MYYNDFQDMQPRRPPQKRKSNGGIIALAVIISLLAGILGGAASFYFLQRRYGTISPLAQSGGTVTLQTAYTPDNEGDSSAYTSAIEQVAASAGPSVVEVTTESKVTHPFWGSYITGGAGSGVVLTEDGYIITNQHVISGANSIVVRLSDGSEYPAVLIGEDMQTDLAVLRIAATGLKPAVFADSDRINVGQLAIAIGNPLGTLGGSVSEGVISAKNRDIPIDGQYMNLLQTSAAINPGNSGGGLFDHNGSLIGIVNAKSSGTELEGLGYAIPSNTVQHIVTDLLEKGYVSGRPALGIEAVAISRRSDLYRYGLSTAGVYVSAVSGSASLQRWDMIESVEGTAIQTVADLKHIIERHEVGDSVEVIVQRNNRRVELTVTLQERAADQDGTSFI